MCKNSNKQPEGASNDFRDHTLKVQQLFVQHQAKLRLYVLSLLPNFHAADDVIQEVFLVVSRKAMDFELGSNFIAWIRCIAMYQIRTYTRNHKRQPCSLADAVIEALAVSIPEDWDSEYEQELESLRQCVKKLAPAAKEMIQLRYFRKRMPTEIAALRNQSINAVNVTLNRARSMIRECIKRRLRLQKVLS